MRTNKKSKTQVCGICDDLYKSSSYIYCSLCMGLLENLRNRSGYTKLTNTITQIYEQII